MSDARRWRTIMKRLAYLRAEASDFVDTFEESVKEIEEKLGGKKKNETPPPQEGVPNAPESETGTSKELSKTSGMSNKSNQTPPQSKEEDLKEKVESPPPEEIPSDDVEVHYKRLWKAIARVTHPDVVGGDEEMISLYKAASAASEKKARGELLDVASEVGIQLKDPHPKMLEDATSRCSHYEAMIRKIGDSVAWQWKHAPEATRQEIIDLILRSRGKKES